MFDKLWSFCHVVSFEIPSDEVNETIVRPIGVEVKALAKLQYCSYFDVLTYILEDCCVSNYFYKLRLLLMVLGTSDGFGHDLWEIPNNELQCPHAFGIRDFVLTWFQDYRRIGHLDDAISLFGFERNCDFLYAFIAYKELQKINPRECSKYASTYLRWYENGIKKANIFGKVFCRKSHFDVLEVFSVVDMGSSLRAAPLLFVFNMVAIPFQFVVGVNLHLRLCNFVCNFQALPK